MAKRKDVRSKRQPAQFDGEGSHPGGVSSEEIAKVFSQVEECFRRQSEFFSRMTRGAGRHHTRSRHSR